MTCSTDYCISGTTNYDGTYSLAGTYDGHDYYTGITYTIYYSTGQTQWCLASTVGDPTCLLFGKSPCTSVCPDLCDEIFNAGICPTPTPTPTAACSIDFDAIFDCEVPITPTPTPTVTPTSTTTPTPTPTNPCGGRAIDVSGVTYTPTPTPTPTLTPTQTPDITRPCNYNGLVTFNTLDDYIRCPNSKQFKDCLNGFIYSTTDVVLNPTGGTPVIGMVYDVTVNEIDVCAEYIGTADNISGVDNITLNSEYGLVSEGGCLVCVPPVSATPTPTPTLTPTPTPSSTPDVCCEYKVTNLLYTANTFNIKNCSNNETQSISINGGSTITVKSYKVPVGNNINIVFVDCPCVTPTPTPTETPTPTPSSTMIVCFNYQYPPIQDGYDVIYNTGYLNSKPYYTLTLGFVWYDSGSGLWTWSSSLGGGTIYDTLNNGGLFYPYSDALPTYPFTWDNINPLYLMSSVVGGCL